MKILQTATVKNIDLNRTTREIIITVSAKGSIFIEEPLEYGFPKLVNGDVLVTGVGILLKHDLLAIKAFQGNDKLQDLIKENDRLKKLSRSIELEHLSLSDLSSAMASISRQMFALQDKTEENTRQWEPLAFKRSCLATEFRRRVELINFPEPKKQTS